MVHYDVSKLVLMTAGRPYLAESALVAALVVRQVCLFVERVQSVDLKLEILDIAAQLGWCFGSAEYDSVAFP